MIIDKVKKGSITIYTVDKDYTDEKLVSVMNKKLNQIKDIIDHDADVFTKEGKLLLRFRKNKLNQQCINDFYDNVIDFAQLKTNNRGSATGSKIKDNVHNPKIMTNIIGFFDTLSPAQKVLLKKQGKTLKTTVRPCRFNMEWPEKYKKIIPLVKQIDDYYQEYVPENYKEQRKKANQTVFRIAGTSFTTITTNVNFQTTVHTDRGDDPDGFGNLTVIERGKYKGGETCFPQYGVGVDIRTGDVIYMNVHEPHGNLPIELEDKDAKRLSIVCYLRKNIWLKTKGKSKRFLETVTKTLKAIKKPV